MISNPASKEILPPCTETEVSLPCSQETATGPYS